MELEFSWILDNLQISQDTTYNKKKRTLKKEIILSLKHVIHASKRNNIFFIIKAYG